MPRTISDTMVKPPPTPCRFVASLYSQVAVRFLLRQVHPLIRFSTTVPLLLLLFFIHSFFPLSFPFFPLFFFPFREISPRRCDGTARWESRPLHDFIPYIGRTTFSFDPKRGAERVYRNRLHRPPSIDPGNSNSNRLESNNAKLGSQNLCPSPFRVLFG